MPCVAQCSPACDAFVTRCFRTVDCYGAAALMARQRLCILSRKKSLYSTQRLVEAAKQQGARALVMDTLRCAMVVSPGGNQLLYRGVEVKGLEAAIPRIGASITTYGMAVVTHLETMGVPVVNPAQSIAKSRDKLRCLQLLAFEGIDVPRTIMANEHANVKRLLHGVNGLPCIIKLLRGTQGVGVMLADTLQEAETIVQTFWGLGQDVCIQEFVKESRGRDVRVLVVGDEVIGAMRRQARGGEFRSNIHRGGEGKSIRLPREYQEVAVRAARAVGLSVCGVDMLEGKDGPKVMELNSSPGFEGLEKATKKDIAGAIVRHALSLSRK
ncbi:MAG: 30S ribosomal protein S6--L-glutamate ligase [Archangium gephyra]|uniref:30S ribosomal protein S6--L-glutamate ligase n=1 Tax=Archangium gephyra TaxID=48 RepID=A0A2W5UXF2_9BACT|nr:MAG: 30S ribosomal protein S6--L-glutamate ligase [Archangium gephyra]